MRLPRPYIAVLFNWNKEKLSTDIMYFLVRKKNTKQQIARARLFFIYERRRLRVRKYLKIGKKTNLYLRPSQATDDLKDAKYVFVLPSDKPWNSNDFLEYCNTFRISNPKLVNLCWYCLMNRNKWTELEEKKPVEYKGKSICPTCSRREIKQELQRSKLVVSSGLTKFYQEQSQRKGELDDIMETILLGNLENPLDNPDSTLFDVIEAKKPEKTSKITNIKKLPKKYSDLLYKEGIKHLLPIQQKSIDAGLLNNEHLLVVAGTSSGKTLIGELAGIKNAFLGKKMIYLSPYVALTNQKHEQFKRRYNKLGLRTIVRVGMSKINVEGEFSPIIDGNYKESDIIVATYEALDFILRQGLATQLGKVGTIVIDEIQMIISEGRGFRLNGLLTRLKAFFPKSQYLYLSATIGNPNSLAKDLEAKCVKYLDRPIPLERHVIMTENEGERLDHLETLCKRAEKQKSKMGYIGQTLVFTNSRRKCESISGILQSKGVRSAYYHAGLTFYQRKKIEEGFEKGVYSTVVTTIALGAGVDFPASQVIFENLAMGANWLSVAEFHQMLGRAGRYGFHERGKVYLLVETGRKIYAGQDLTEDQVAFQLLTKPVEDVEPELDNVMEQEEVLAIIVAFGSVSIKRDKEIFVHLLGRSRPLSEIMRDLKKMKMIYVENKIIYPTKLGKATSVSFLAPAYALRILQDIKRQKRKGFDQNFAIRLAAKMESYGSAHLSSRLQAEIERVLKTHISTNLFSGTVLDLYLGTGWGERRPTKRILDTFSTWTQELFTCNCKDKPFCNCGETEFSSKIIKLRLKGYSPSKICTEIRKTLDVQLYPGDVYSYLDRVIHHLQAIQRLANVLNEKNLRKQAKECSSRIEKPKKT